MCEAEMVDGTNTCGKHVEVVHSVKWKMRQLKRAIRGRWDSPAL